MSHLNNYNWNILVTILKPEKTFSFLFSNGGKNFPCNSLAKFSKTPTY